MYVCMSGWIFQKVLAENVQKDLILSQKALISNQVDMVCLSPVGYGTPYPTGDKHTISTLLIKPIFSVSPTQKNSFFQN